MAAREDRGLPVGIATNDNGAAETRVQSAVLTLARLLGREQFLQLHATNDHRPVDEAGDRLDRQE